MKDPKAKEAVDKIVRPVLKAPGHSEIRVDKAITTQASDMIELQTTFAKEVTRKEEVKGTEGWKEKIKPFAIRDWSQPPVGVACHAWLPGVCRTGPKTSMPLTCSDVE